MLSDEELDALCSSEWLSEPDVERLLAQAREANALRAEVERLRAELRAVTDANGDGNSLAVETARSIVRICGASIPMARGCSHDEQLLATAYLSLLGRHRARKAESASLRAEVERLRRSSYPHMCQDDHPRIGHSENTDPEELSCPVCNERNVSEQREDEIASLRVSRDKLEDALRDALVAVERLRTRDGDHSEWLWDSGVESNGHRLAIDMTGVPAEEREALAQKIQDDLAEMSRRSLEHDSLRARAALADEMAEWRFGEIRIDEWNDWLARYDEATKETADER